MRELKLNYLDKVQLETANFLNERIKHDFIRPDRELTLDLTIKEAELLASANDSIRAQADSGALKDLHTRFTNAQSRVASEYFTVREQLSKTLQIIESKENEIYTRLVEEFDFNTVKLHGQGGSFIDLLGLSTGDNAFSNLTIVESAIEKDHEASDQLKNIQGELHSFIGVKYHIFQLESELKEAYLVHVSKGEEDTTARDELNVFKVARDNYERSFNRHGVADHAKSEYEAFTAQIHELAEGRAKALINDFKEYDQAYTERQRVYSTFSEGTTSEAMQAFRNDLLQHLAGSIIVKEHRQRYQKEQFDRYLSSLQYQRLYSRGLNLRQFCTEYANMIEVLIEDSHNDRSPKIEANYDDFGERTVRPFNATIFYYFFSADRRKRTLAQWFLAAARYPNERVRRAYLRFFA